jgi:hypothetical protein
MSVLDVRYTVLINRYKINLGWIIYTVSDPFSFCRVLSWLDAISKSLFL